MDNETDQNFFNITLKLLSVSTLRTISTLLNPVKFIPTKDNLQRDWRGLADLTGCNCEELSLFNCSSDPTLSVLKNWCKKSGSIIGLLIYIQKLDRFDIYEDVLPLIICDINNHKSSRENNVDTSLFITLKDRELCQQNLAPKQYDACILYADEDAKFAAEMVTVLEHKYKLEIFVKERDLIGGTLEHDATMKIIANRCKRVIIILSSAFLESSENRYFISFAQSIGIERNIIPCIYKDCVIPTELKHLHKLNYTRSPIFVDFFEKLYTSIIPANGISTRYIASPCPHSVSNSVKASTNDIKAIEGFNTLPVISKNDNAETQEQSTDILSRISLPSTSKPAKTLKLPSFFRKKILKKKTKVLMAS